MSAKSMRMLVTGGRGRLATLMADHFRAPAHEITLFSRHASEGFRPLADLLSPALLGGADVIFHLAWSSLPSTSEQHPDIEWREDLPFLEKLLEALATVPVDRRPQLVFFSSGGAVYGNAPGRPNRESDACAPIGRYGRAKLAAETLITGRALRDGLDCTILRISNPYGYPVPRNRVQGLIPHALRCATDGQPLALWGDGSARKDFLYYTDFLSALEMVLGLRLTGIFNLCAGESHCVSEVIRLVEVETNRAILLHHEPAPTWDVHDSRLDHALFTSATGWQPQVRLSEGIRRASAGYSSH